MCKKYLVRGIIAAATLMLAGLLHAGTTLADSTITITSPRSSESVIDTNVQISGTAPAGKLIDIIITDADSSKPFVQHQSTGNVDGTVTSDDNGGWVFTPQQRLVPGQFSVYASYNDNNGQPVKSNTVNFVVTTAGGSSEILSRAFIRQTIIAIVVIILVVVWLILYRRRARRRNQSGGISRPASSDTTELDAHEGPLFMKTREGREFQSQQSKNLKLFEEETRKIEDELAKTAEELERTNEEVVELRHGLENKTLNVNNEAPAKAEPSQKSKHKSN